MFTFISRFFSLHFYKLNFRRYHLRNYRKRLYDHVGKSDVFRSDWKWCSTKISIGIATHIFSRRFVSSHNCRLLKRTHVRWFYRWILSIAIFFFFGSWLYTHSNNLNANLKLTMIIVFKKIFNWKRVDRKIFFHNILFITNPLINFHTYIIDYSIFSQNKKKKSLQQNNLLRNRV